MVEQTKTGLKPTLTIAKTTVPAIEAPPFMNFYNSKNFSKGGIEARSIRVTKVFFIFTLYLHIFFLFKIYTIITMDKKVT